MLQWGGSKTGNHLWGGGGGASAPTFDAKTQRREKVSGRAAVEHHLAIDVHTKPRGRHGAENVHHRRQDRDAGGVHLPNYGAGARVFVCFCLFVCLFVCLVWLGWVGLVWFGLGWFVLFCFVSFRFVSFCVVLFCVVLFCFDLLCCVVLRRVVSCFVLFCVCLFCVCLFCFVLLLFFGPEKVIHKLDMWACLKLGEPPANKRVPCFQKHPCVKANRVSLQAKVKRGGERVLGWW